MPNDLEFTVTSVSRAKAIIKIPVSDHKPIGAIQLEAMVWGYSYFSSSQQTGGSLSTS